MEKQELITVIVPVHNAENYLVKCIDSIVGQTYRNLEIILVDDASTDRSAQICDDYAQKDPRVKVIHKQGKGEGGARARNMGIEQAKGDCFIFFDSDDYMETNMLETMHDKMIREGSQGAVCSFWYIDKQEQKLPWKTPELCGVEAKSGKEAAAFFLTSKNVEGFSWNKLFRREILMDNQLRFDDSMNSFVDMYAMFRAILACERVSFCGERFYYYRQHEVSCVHTMSRRKLGNFKRVLGQISEKAVQNGLKKESQYFVCYRMVLQLFDMWKMRKSFESAEWKEICQEYSWNKIFGCSFLTAVFRIFAHLKEDKMKTFVKTACVWLNYR